MSCRPGVAMRSPWLPTTPPSGAAARPASRTGGHYRWVICALLFVATTINYVDRQVIAILKPTLQELFAWTERDYAAIVFTFQLAYAIGLLGVRPSHGQARDTQIGFPLAIAALEPGRCRCTPSPTGSRGCDPPTVLVDPPSIVLLTGVGRRASRSRDSSSVSVKRATSRRRSRRSPSGSRAGARARDGHLQLRHQRRRARSRRSSCRGSRCASGGSGRSSSRARSGFVWLIWWVRALCAARASIRALAGRSCAYIRSDPRVGHAGALGVAARRTGRRGPSRSASS